MIQMTHLIWHIYSGTITRGHIYFYILLKCITYKQQTQAVTELDKQGSKGALTAAYRHKIKKHKQYKPSTGKSYKQYKAETF